MKTKIIISVNTEFNKISEKEFEELYSNKDYFEKTFHIAIAREIEDFIIRNPDRFEQIILENEQLISEIPENINSFQDLGEIEISIMSEE